MNNFYVVLSLFFALFFNISLANAKEQPCDEAVIEIVTKHLKLDSWAGFDEGSLDAEACKSWPQDKNIVLTTFAYSLFDKKHPEKFVKNRPNIEYEKDIIIAMIDKSNEHVISSYQTTIDVGDASIGIDSYSLQLDIARYQLAPNMRAFGLRFHNAAHSSSCGEVWQGDELTLFVKEGSKLKPVLGLPMSLQQSTKGCINNQIDGSVWEDATLTISIEETHSHSYADLLLAAKIETITMKDGDAVSTNPRIEHQLLHYDGKKYVADTKETPWWLGTNWAVH